jgi:ABC-2 type transport system ATP-binding protein
MGSHHSSDHRPIINSRNRKHKRPTRWRNTLPDLASPRHRVDDDSMPHAVQLEHVTKTFGSHTAVRDLSLEIPEGSIFGFIGPNGSGKTTTLRMISRIYLPDSGAVRVLGENHHGPANDRVAYLPEERGLYRQMRVGELLQFYAALKSYHPPRSEIRDWLARVDLADYEKKRVSTLSKGMSQKLQFIATIITKPTLLLLDEPFSGLDPLNAVVLRKLIDELRAAGTTIIFSTHDMRMAEQLCDRIFMIYKGDKVLDGTPDSIRSQHASNLLIVRFQGTTPALEGLPGATWVGKEGDTHRLTLEQGADHQQILSQLMQRGRVDRFELSAPSLQDIFVKIAAPDAEALATLG